MRQTNFLLPITFNLYFDFIYIGPFHGQLPEQKNDLFSKTFKNRF
jgi:hypothetical protein